MTVTRFLHLSIKIYIQHIQMSQRLQATARRKKKKADTAGFSCMENKASPLYELSFVKSGLQTDN